MYTTSKLKLTKMDCEIIDNSSTKYLITDANTAVRSRRPNQPRTSLRNSFGRGSFFCFLLVTVLIVAVVLPCQTLADDNNNSNNNNNNKKNGLFSQVNSWFSRLRGNRDNNNNNDNNDDKKNDEKKEESIKPNPAQMYHPGMGGMPGYSPLGPYGAPPMMGAPMYAGSMGMPTHQFAHHVPRPHGMHPAALPMSFGGMSPVPMAPMSNPFAFSGSHMMPVHHDYPGGPMHAPHHPHGAEGFSPYGSPYGNFGNGEGHEESYSNGPGQNGGSSDQMDGHSGGQGEDYGYHKK